MPGPVPIILETLQEPEQYSHAQIRRAIWIATALDRGKFLLVEPPAPR